MTKLNLGSGYSGNDALYVITQTQKNDEWTHVDVCPLYQYGPNFQCYDFSEGIREPDNSVTHIWMGDAFEHVFKHRARKVLEECFRVLASGGQLLVSVPDMGRAMSKWLAADGDDPACADLIWGQQDERDQKNCGPDSHHFGFTQNSLGKLFKSAGFVGIERVKVHDTWYELAMSGRKP